MKYTILGFSQAKMIELDMDLQDALILRWFVDFKDTDSMVSEYVAKEEKVYYWIDYKKMIEDIPVISIKSKDVIRRRFKKMVEKGILIHYTKRKGGTYSFYNLGKNYKLLICSTLESAGATQKSEGYDSKVGEGTTEKSEGYDSKVGTKDSSIKDRSTNNKSIKDKSVRKKTSTPKNNYNSEEVLLTEEQYEILLNKYGSDDTRYMIKTLDNYKLSTGKQYKSDYHAILNWVVKRLQEDKVNGTYKVEKPDSEKTAYEKQQEIVLDW